MAFNFGLANDYNVFVFGDMTLSNTDAEGRVAVGGNATLSNYGIGAGITALPPRQHGPLLCGGRGRERHRRLQCQRQHGGQPRQYHHQLYHGQPPTVF